MTPAEPRRRRDVKTQDREKSMSPLDKDQLKRRCLERVRTERSRLMARMRDRPGSEGGRNLYGDAGATGGADSPLATAGVQRESSPSSSLSSAREILRQGLSELSGGNSTTSRRLREQQHQHPNHKQEGGAPRTPSHQAIESSPARPDNNGGGSAHHFEQQHGQQHREPSSPSFLSAIDEENANYLNACAGGGRGRGSPQQPRTPCDSRRSSGTPVAVAAALAPMGTSRREESRGFIEGESDDARMADDSREAELMLQQQQQHQQQQQQQQHQPEAMVEGDELGWGDGGVDGYCDEEHMLSPEEYLEMMQYIEEACREEDLRAEAEVLEDYEVTKRLEEEEVEYAVSSALEGVDGNGQMKEVLCPVCKRDYLLQAGPPSASIVCACGFRLDTGGDRIGLEHLKQQLAETYSQHSAACSAEPSFAVEGAPGSDVLWSSCDGCGFSRVVI